jgi:invasion protein IalB
VKRLIALLVGVAFAVGTVGFAAAQAQAPAAKPDEKKASPAPAAPAAKAVGRWGICLRES